MRKLVVILSFTTAMFAASTIYLLSERREAVSAPGPPVLVATPPVEPAPAAPSSAVAKPASAIPVAASERPATTVMSRLGEMDRRFLAQASDPTSRLKLLADTKAGLSSEYQRLGQIVGLVGDEQDRLLSFLAEQQVSGRESYLRCLADSTRDSESCPVDLGNFDDSIQALLGAERQKRFEKYLTSLDERRLVTRMRGAMPDDQFLSDDQTDRLVAALADENDRRQQDLGDAFNSADRIPGEAPLVYTAGATRESLTTEAREHFERLHTRAAKLLTPAQLKTYDDIMEQRFGRVEYAIDAFLHNRAAVSGH